MKKILLAVVLGVAVGAWAQSTAQPAQQPAAPPTSSVNPPTGSVNPPTGSVNPPTGSVNPPTGQTTQSAPSAPQAAAPVIKDPAEYNAYVGAIQQSDPNAKISALEAFVTQYPNSIMKNQALEILMGTYQQTNNVKKTMDTATKLVTADPCQVKALALLTYFDRVLAQSGDANGPQLSADAGKYGQQGMDCLPKFSKPEGTSDADFQKLKDQVKVIFDAGIGWSALQGKDYPKAAEHLKAAVEANSDSQKDFMLVWPLALAYLTPADPKTPLDPAGNVNGIWYAARAAALAPAASEPGVEKYAHGQFVKYRQDEEGWPELLAAAKAGPTQVPIRPPLTPADEAHKMVLATAPDKMDFAQWEYVLSNGTQEDRDTVWNAIKGKPVQMQGTVIKATTDQCEVHAAVRSCEAQLDIAGSLDDIEKKIADITLTFDDKLPMKLIPKEGASQDFQGNPVSYTPNPFVMTMEKGMLPKPKAAPPVHKPPVHKPAAAQ
jgi:hypothetical protein